MKRMVPAAITAVLIAIALWAGRSGPDEANESSAGPRSPAQCIDQMFDAAERGDVPRYLDCFAGPQRARLDGELADQSRDQFARALTASVAELRGRAVAVESQTPDRCVLVVEHIFASRTDRQTYELVCDGDSSSSAATWRIHVVHRADPRQPRKAYGTPVWE